MIKRKLLKWFNKPQLNIEISIDTLPIKLFYKIVETTDFTLLPRNNYSEEKLIEIWTKIYDEFQSRDNNELSIRIFRISVDIEYLHTKYNLIIMCIDSLKFDYQKELIDILKEHGYHINEKNYAKSLESAERNAKGIFAKIELLKNQLPKETKTKKESSIDDVLAGYSTILGFNIGDFNKITCSEYLGWKNQVEVKIKNQEKQIRELKSRKKNGK